MLTAVFLGATDGRDPSVVSPGLAGFLVTFAIAVATVFLVRSMVKHLRKVRYGPGPEGEQTPERSATPEDPPH